VLLFFAMLFAWKYPITRESHQATLRQLAKQDGTADPQEVVRSI
jgi:hypothetical protein